MAMEPVIMAAYSPITIPEQLLKSKTLADDMPFDIWMNYDWDMPHFIVIVKRALKRFYNV